MRVDSVRAIALLLATAGMFAFQSSAGERLADTASANHRVTEESPDGVGVEFRFPPPLVVLSGDEPGVWAQIRVNGTTRAGRDGELLLPEYSMVIDLPTGTEPTLEVLEQSGSRFQLPAPPAVVAVDPQALETTLNRPEPEELGRLRPESAVVLEELGMFRHTRLARLTVRPIHYDPAEGSWSSVRQLRVRVVFDAFPTAQAATTSAATTTQAPIPEPRASVMTPLKILIREDGLYRVTHADLLAAAIDPTAIDPATFVLTNRGSEVAIEVSDGGDGSFDPGDSIRFFGLMLGGEESRDNVYRLTGGYESGLRMAALPAHPDMADPLAEDYENVARKEVDILYFASVPEDSPTPWLWESLAVTTPGTAVFTDQTLILNNVSTRPATGRLEVQLQSRRETPGPSPNHHVRTYLNGHLVDDRTWTGLQAVTVSGDVPQSWLLEGANTVRIENPADLGVNVQTEYTDWIRLTYHDQYVSEGDYLEFGGETTGPWRFEITGFSGPDIRVYDVDDPMAPLRLTGVEVGPPSCFDCTVSFRHLLDAPPGRFVAVRPDAAKAPHGFVVDEPSDLRLLAPSGADMLIVAYDDFLDAVEPLVTLRESQGLRVVGARLTDVYDEFNGGIAEAQGIKNFVRWAFENYDPPAPTYLLLVGDATFDPKDHKGQGDNYVPAKFFYSPGFGYVPTETWYGAVSGDDDIPDLAVGRISARSVGDVETYVANLLASEDFPQIAALNSGLLYVTDDDDAQFEAVTENLIGKFHPPAMEVRRVYLSASAGTGAATDEIRAALDEGSLITAYFGHGGRTGWAQENLWLNSDVGSLQASGRFSYVLALNCVNAFFTNLDSEPYALGEKWNLVADRGAIANWSPSALGTLFNYQVIADRLYEEILVRKETRTGMAAWKALVDAYVFDNIDIVNLRDMIFIGDPAAVLPLDSDRDGILERDELGAGSDPDDADSDDDGLTDDQEPSWDSDTDGDGAINAADHDSDNDGLPDGLESGLTEPSPATDLAVGHFVADADPSSLTGPLLADTDGGGAPDGAEDRNGNGSVDPGETDPQNPADDLVCAVQTPAEVTALTLVKDGSDVVISWEDQILDDPCLLYRVYVACEATAPEAYAEFTLAGVSTEPAWPDREVSDDDTCNRYYLVTATSPNHGEGPLGHYGF